MNTENRLGTRIKIKIKQIEKTVYSRVKKTTVLANSDCKTKSDNTSFVCDLKNKRHFLITLRYTQPADNTHIAHIRFAYTHIHNTHTHLRALTHRLLTTTYANVYKQTRVRARSLPYDVTGRIHGNLYDLRCTALIIEANIRQRQRHSAHCRWPLNDMRLSSNSVTK